MIAQSINEKALSLTEQTLLKTLSSNGQDIFTIEDAQKIIEQTRPAIRKILQGLVRSRWLHRLERGKYLIVPLSAGTDAHFTPNELVIASHLISPYYISYWTALSYYGYTEQPSRSVYVIALKRRLPLVWRGVTYRFVTVRPHKFFGYVPTYVGDQRVDMASPEKAIIDGLDHPEYCGGIVQIAKGLWRGRNELQFDSMTAIARRMKNHVIFKRLGYLMERLELGSETLRHTLEGELSAGYSRLDPLSPPEGGYITRWRLLVNVADEELLGWRES